MAVTAYNLSSFGAVLKAFRTRRHLTQQQLARLIGVHRSAVIRWEQGDFLPQSRTLVLELARHLCLDEQETRHLLEASLTALSPYWHVPLPRNPFFTGREAILEALHTQLGVERAVALTHASALHGLGGVGKTQIALEYAYRHALEYTAVFWIAAETEASIISTLLHLAEVLQVPERGEQEQQRVVAAVQRWLTTHRQWLVIWDNVEDFDLMPRFLPPTRQGAVLITTRCQTLGTLARSLDLVPMEQEEGIVFLLRRAKILDQQADVEQVQQFAARMPAHFAAAAELVTIMGGLPLTLDQAGAYLETTRCGLPTYLDLFRRRRGTLLQQRGEGARDHPASMTATFRLAMSATVGRHPAVGDLLRACALLAADTIPEELLVQGADSLGVPLAHACSDDLEWNRLVGVACSASLLQRQPEARTLSMHRLVQAILQEEMNEQERTAVRQRLAHALQALFPEMSYDSWQQCERLLSQALLVADALPEQAEDQELAALLQKVADYLRLRAQYKHAQSLYERALRILERVLGPEHSQVATLLNRLAAILDEQGEKGQAESLYKRALQISEQILGPEHADLAYPLHNLAGFYFDRGKYQQAEPLYQRALRIFEQTLGPDHSMVAEPLNGMADLYLEQEHYNQAELFYERALRISEARGSAHPQVARMLDGLAKLYTRQEKVAKAQELQERALQIQEQVLGPQHPHVAYPLLGLAILSQKRGEYEQAELFYQRALAIREQALGDDNFLLVEALGGLANLSREEGNYAQAEELYRRALAILEEHRSQDHPETAQTLHGLALLRQRQGRLDEALSLVERVLQIREQALGAAHSKTVATRTLYTHLKEALADKKAQIGIQTGKRFQHQEAQHGPQSTPTQRKGSLSRPLHMQAIVLFPRAEQDPLEAFLAACCELHPLAWCTIRELWDTYARWTTAEQGCVPLPRRALAAQLKARGCRVDRTSTVRIWRGLRLVQTSP
jgi:tetratricopeptide (TPR) repeat protein/transcriptional regulator with XRE-family HTH domain